MKSSMSFVLETFSAQKKNLIFEHLGIKSSGLKIFNLYSGLALFWCRLKRPDGVNQCC